MPDNKSKRGRQDRSKIALKENYEVSYVTKKQGWTEGNLQVAAHVTGSRSRKVITSWLILNWPRIEASRK